MTMNLRQFFNLLRQQRLFSGIYITSTALSTALTMTLFLVLYIMLGPVYPEQERSRMAVVKLVRYAKEETGGYRINGASMALADSLRNMPEVEWLTAIRSAIDGAVIGSEGEHIPCMTQPVDDAYWHVFNFRFIHGRSFSREECEAHSPVCVISEGMARRLFGHTDMAGRMQNAEDADLFVRLPDDTRLRVVGIVEDVSMATPMTFARLWTLNEGDSYIDPHRYLGPNTLVMLLHKGKTVEQLQKRVAGWEERVNQEMAGAGEEYRLHMDGQPDAHWQSCFRSARSSTNNWQPLLRKILGLLLAFLLIPAMNMSSMVASRINARISEMGIRRAYGACRTTLLWQVLQENFLLTLMGSLLGLAISWLIVTLGADWLPFIFSGDRTYAFTMIGAVHIHADMLFSGWIMTAVLAVTLVLNLISALIPTIWILHRSVTEEINHKR